MLKIPVFLFAILSFSYVQAQQKTYTCYFQINSSEYESDSLVKLQDWLHLSPPKFAIDIHLIAYTDTVGSIKYNDVLAKKRLENIASVLKSMDYNITNTETIGKRYNTTDYSTNQDFRKVEILFKINVPMDSVKITQQKEEKVIAKEPQPKTSKKSKKPTQKSQLEEFELMGDNAIINLNIEFRNNTNVYKDQKSEKQVYYLAEFLKKHPEKKVIILGHVCCTDNLAVSINRAKRVYEDLRKYKINKKRMNYKGLSNTVPLVEEVDERAKQQNRRVEVIFYE